MRVLAIDDDQAVLRAICRLIRAKGHECSTAQDGDAAIERIFAGHHAGERPFELVLLDLEMPGMDGYEFLRQRKTLKRLQAIPVIIITQQTEDELRVRGEISVQSIWLAKPVNFDQLEAILKRFPDATPADSNRPTDRPPPSGAPDQPSSPTPPAVPGEE